MSRRTTSWFFLAPALFAACGDDGGNDPIDAPSAIDAPVTPDAPDAAPAWHPPACTMVTGTGAVTFTHDEGVTVAPRDTVLTGVKYTFGLVALSTPNALVASHAGRILRSDDAGCSWRDLGDAGGLAVLVASGDQVYGYVDNNPQMIRIDGDTVTQLRDHATGVVGMGIDAAQHAHLRIMDSDGQIWDSTDSGATWSPVGRRATTGQIVYRGAFSPTDLADVIAGTSVTGAQVTTDSGATWTPATGLSTGNANAMNIAISPADPNIVWVTGVDLADDSKDVWRSTDAGLTFAPAFDNTGRTITNGMPLFAHPTNPAILYATFGTYFQGYGTDIYRYDAGNDMVTTAHQDFHDVMAIAFLPGDPTWMFLGVTNEQIGGF